MLTTVDGRPVLTVRNKRGEDDLVIDYAYVGQYDIRVDDGNWHKVEEGDMGITK